MRSDKFGYSISCSGGKCCIIDGRTGFLTNISSYASSISQDVLSCEVSSAAFFGFYKAIHRYQILGYGLVNPRTYSSAKLSGIPGLYSSEKSKLFPSIPINNINNDSSSNRYSNSNGSADNVYSGCASRLAGFNATKNRLGHWVGVRSLLNVVDYCSKSL